MMFQPYLLIVQLLQTLFVGANHVIISSKTMVAWEKATVKSIQSVQLVVELSNQNLENASNSNSDTECESCRSGLTYNPSPTYEPCLACTTACPNGSHINSPCNTTNNMECKLILDLSKLTTERISPPNKQEPVLEIVLGTTIPLLIVVLVFGCIVYRWYRNRQNERRSGESHAIITHGVVIDRNETASCQRTDNSAAASNDIPSWIRDCIKDENVDWPKMFALCPRCIDIHRWESFIRTLFVVSGKATIGQYVVDCTIEQYPREKVDERIYQALRSWQEKCYLDNEHEMVQQFCEAYNCHASSRAL